MNKMESQPYHIQRLDTQRHFQMTSTAIYAVLLLPVSMTSEEAEQKENSQPLTIYYFWVPLFPDTHWRGIAKNAKRV